MNRDLLVLQIIRIREVVGRRQNAVEIQNIG